MYSFNPSICFFFPLFHPPFTRISLPPRRELLSFSIRISYIKRRELDRPPFYVIDMFPDPGYFITIERKEELKRIEERSKVLP